MAFKVKKHGTVTATFATAQQVDISHANDSVAIGDETNKMGPLQLVGGVYCVPVSIESIDTTGLALDATLTGGSLKAKIVNGSDTAEFDDVGGEKALKVSVISSVGGGSAPAETDNADFTAGTSQFTPIGAQFDSDGSADLADGKMGVIRATAERALHVHIASQAAGGGGLTDAELRASAVPVSVASLPLPTGAATSAKQDTLQTAIDAIKTAVEILDNTVSGAEMQVDIVSSALPSGAATSALQSTANTALAAIQTAVEILDNTVSGSEMQVDIVGALPAGANAIGKLAANSGVDIGDVDVTSCANTTGNVAHDSADSGNPIKVGGVATSANITRVTSGDRAHFITDLGGRQVTVPHQVRELLVKQTTTISNTTETTILTGAASTFHDLVFLMITNTSSSATRVDIRDDTGGTVMFSVAIAANGGAVIPFPVAIPQTTLADNWTAQLSGAVTDIRILAIAVKNT